MSIDWHALFNVVDVPVLVQDNQFRVLWVNKKYAELFESLCGDPVGKTCLDSTHGATEFCSDCPRKRLMEIKEPDAIDCFYPCLGKHFRVLTYPLFDDKGRVSHCVCFMRDISPQQQVEEIREQYEQAEALLVMLRSVCNELCQPMQAVTGYSELVFMRMAKGNPLYRRMVNLREEVNRMVRVAAKLGDILRNGIHNNGTTA
ncbi:MAG: PAS domain-containing protein [Candidatus Hydrogenedentes bacterium]|nr:PAS domain-containing protein [Candidatus Hydrogenedentota bacterium]